MDLDRHLTDSQLPRDLLIQPATGDKLHYFALPRSQRFKALEQFGLFRFLMMRNPVVIQCLVYRIELWSAKKTLYLDKTP